MSGFENQRNDLSDFFVGFFFFLKMMPLSHRKCLVENVLNNSYGCKHVMFWN